MLQYLLAICLLVTQGSFGSVEDMSKCITTIENQIANTRIFTMSTVEEAEEETDQLLIIMQGHSLAEPSGWQYYDSDLEIKIYNISESSEPPQIIRTKTTGNIFKGVRIEDVNFDGYKDFYFHDNLGTGNYYYKFLIWNPESNYFTMSNELNNISMPIVDSETEVISGYWRGSPLSYEKRFYKYIESKLTCIRIIKMGYPYTNEDNELVQHLQVDTLEDGHLQTIFSKETISSKDFAGEVYEEFFRWHDLTYRGK